MFKKQNISKAVKAVFVLLPFIYANIANSAGFALYEFSARGNAMGGAVMANEAEPASIATNPALITKLKGTQVQVGMTVVQADATTDFNGSEGEIDGSSPFFLPNFYATYQAHEHIYLGLGGFSRFGLGGKYKDYETWPGTQKAYKVGVESFSLTPQIAVKATESLSLSMGLEFMTLNFKESLVLGKNTDISGSGVSWGGSFGVFYDPQWAEKWAFGATYRTKMRQVLDGRVSTDAGGAIPSDDVRGSVTLPDMIAAGISFTPSSKLVMEAGIVYTFWSSYDAIRIDYKTFQPAPGLYYSIIDEKNYKDSPRFNIGAEYALNNTWKVRGGYVYDISPISTDHMDTLVPVDDRHIFNAGVGYENDVWGLDFSYSLLLAKDLKGQTNPLPTTGKPVNIEYKNGSSHLFGLTFKYKFDTPLAHSH